MGEVGVKCQVKSLKNNVSSFATSANTKEGESPFGRSPMCLSPSPKNQRVAAAACDGGFEFCFTPCLAGVEFCGTAQRASPSKVAGVLVPILNRSAHDYHIEFARTG